MDLSITKGEYHRTNNLSYSRGISLHIILFNIGKFRDYRRLQVDDLLPGVRKLHKQVRR